MVRWVMLMLLLQSGTQVYAEVTLDSIEKRLSYTVGQQIGQQLEMEQVPVEREALFQGIRDYLERNEPMLDYTQQRQAVTDFQEGLNQALQELKRKNLLQGQAYLKGNATKRGVKVTKSGLQYKVLQAGSGEKPTAEGSVKVHYEGRLIDGTIFDSSYQRGEPVQLTLPQVIKGWQEALPMMPAGSKWQLTIPAELAYGEQGSGDKIPPNSTLIFDIELLETNILQPTRSGH